MKNRLILIIFIFTSLSLSCSNVRPISLYVVSPIKGSSPVIDGVLDEDCWKRAGVNKEFYQYWKVNPGRGELDTEFRMLYDKDGLYIGIVNYDENVDSIKATIVRRDASDLWTDDCAEIYFDPDATAVGYIKFTVNFLGTRYDMKRIDTANINESWNGEGWYYKTSKGKNYWVIEAYFPWTDLGKKPKEGNIWMFNLVRYSYSTGTFRGVTWSPGGSYASPEHFGYIYFSSDRMNIKKMGKTLASNILPPWELLIGDSFLYCVEKNRYQHISSSKLLSLEKEKAEEIINKTDCLLANIVINDKVKQLKESAKKEREKFYSIDFSIKEPTEIKEVVKRIREIRENINQIYWELMIEKEFEAI